MYGSKTTMIIDGRMNVVKNTAHVSGGVFYFASGSECWVMENTSLLLAHNHAGQFGGAVYIQDDSFYRCVIFRFKQYQANCFLQPTRWPTTATVQILEVNYAEEAGSGLYGGLVDRCKLELWGNEVDDSTSTEVFEWIFQNFSDQNASNSSFTSSDPIGVCLCISNKPHCNITREVTAFPGGTLYVSVVAIGQI